AWTSGEGASGVGERSSVDGELEEQQRSEQETGRAVEQVESSPEESQVVSAAQEVPGELPSHASGEAWPFQQPRTLLEMLAEHWEESEGEVKDILTYTKELREDLHTLWEEAHTALRDAQSKQKKYYDADSTPRTLKVGDKELGLLPTCESKLLARWQGPYEVIAQINPTTYKLEIPPGTGREQIYHINLLKKWYEATNEHPIMYITKEAEQDIPIHPMPMVLCLRPPTSVEYFSL
ncbi:hypothetical protein NDU88_001167, partial [Pleurodeles waltl]